MIGTHRQIETLREQTPERLRDHYKSLQLQLEEFNEQQKKELAELKLKLKEMDSMLEGASKRENDLRFEIEQKEAQILKVRSELAQTQVMQASAERLKFSLAHDIGHLAFEGRAEDYKIKSFLDSEDRYTSKPENPSVDSLVDWFLENYKDPVHGVPVDSGEYIYVLGGPYHADEELFEHFPDVDENIVNAAVEKIESDGTINWVKRWQY